MRLIRVAASRGEALARALREAGFSAEWLGPGTASTSLDGGCTDPECCPQHPGAAHAPEAWGSIRTNASGTRAHRVLVAAGLVEPCGCRYCKRLPKA